MREAATITFEDADSSEEAIAIVRFDTDYVGLCISLKSDGDVEVVMAKDVATRLVQALQQAIQG
jgi:hypothetical protein